MSQEADAAHSCDEDDGEPGKQVAGGLSELEKRGAADAPGLMEAAAAGMAPAAPAKAATAAPAIESGGGRGGAPARNRMLGRVVGGGWEQLDRMDDLVWQGIMNGSFNGESLGDAARCFMDENHEQVPEVARRAEVSPGYVYQILSGKRAPRRDILIRLAFGLKLDVPEASELLESGEACRLRADVRRDAIIAMCLHARTDLGVCQEWLEEMGEVPIAS